MNRSLEEYLKTNACRTMDDAAEKKIGVKVAYQE